MAWDVVCFNKTMDIAFFNGLQCSRAYQNVLKSHLLPVNNILRGGGTVNSDRQCVN